MEGGREEGIGGEVEGRRMEGEREEGMEGERGKGGGDRRKGRGDGGGGGSGPTRLPLVICFNFRVLSPSGFYGNYGGPVVGGLCSHLLGPPACLSARLIACLAARSLA